MIGAFAGNVVLQLPGAIKSGMRFRPVFKLSDPDLVKYVKLTLPLILGLGMTFSNEIFSGTLDPSSLKGLHQYKLRIAYHNDDCGSFRSGFRNGILPFYYQNGC